jgi:hypothetical protein
MSHLNKEINLIMHQPLAAQQGDDRRNGLPWWAWLLILLAPILVFLWWLRRRSGEESHDTYPAVDPTAPEVGHLAGFDAFDAGRGPDFAGVEALDDDDSIDEGEGATPDDLTLIEGIGPKLSAILNGAGITTFAQLAVTTPQEIQSILRAAGHRIADPTSWPDQARLLVAGDIEGFQALTARLKGGRYTQ